MEGKKHAIVKEGVLIVIRTGAKSSGGGWREWDYIRRKSSWTAMATIRKQKTKTEETIY